MLRLIITGGEVFDDETQTFSYLEDVELDLEHSLFSLSKWESQWQKPFLAPGKKTAEEIFSYIKAMVISPKADLDALERVPQRNLDQIQQYIDSAQSATTFGELPSEGRRGPGETITAELIYYWMVAFNIPWEAQHWHLNRLFSLIRICNIKQNPKKMSKQEIAQRNREENARRRAELGTKG